MPEFVRRAIEAQGKVDPDEVAALAALIQGDPGPDPDLAELSPQGQLDLEHDDQP